MGFANNIGAVLTTQRMAKGWSKAEAARQTGYHVSSIRNMEKNNGGVLWSRYALYMHMLGITWKLVPKDKKEQNE